MEGLPEQSPIVDEAETSHTCDEAKLTFADSEVAPDYALCSLNLELDVPVGVVPEEGQDYSMEQTDSDALDDADNYIFIDACRPVRVATSDVSMLMFQVGFDGLVESGMALLDTGASRSSIRIDVVQRLGLLVDESQLIKIKVAGGNVFKSLGLVRLSLKMGEVNFDNVEFIVLPNQVEEEIILGKDFCRTHGLRIRPSGRSILINRGVLEWTITCWPHQHILLKTHCLAKCNIALTETNNEMIKIPIKCSSLKFSDVQTAGSVKLLWYYSDEQMDSGLNCNYDGIPGIMEISNSDPFILIQKADLIEDNLTEIKEDTVLGTIRMVLQEEQDEFDEVTVVPDENWRETILIDDLTPAQQDQVHVMLNTVKNVFSRGGDDIGNAAVTAHHIDLLDDTPIYQRPRTFPPPIAAEIEKQCQELEMNDIIEKSKSPWSSPIVPIKKKDGTLRLCIDYRKLNRVTKTDKFPLPNLSDAIYGLHGVKHFTSLDLRKGYYQIPIDKQSREFTAFTTPRNHYQFKRISFGLKNAPAAFQREMQSILKTFPWCKVIVYIDDILILSNSFEEHMELVQKVLSTLNNHNIKLNPEKCQWFRPEVDFLGHHVSRTGITKQQKYIDKVDKFPRPETIRQLREFLGLVNFQRKFVPNCSQIQQPLSQLTGGKGNKRLTWTEEMIVAFDTLKAEMKKEIELTFPNYLDTKNKLELWVDASETGAGACLAQRQDGQLKIIAYASMVFTSAQQKYSTLERELAAMRWGINTFKTFLYGIEFIVWTDHQPLIFLHNMRLVDGRLARTLENLSDFNFIIKYTPGRMNHAADALSRIPIVPTCYDIDLCNKIPNGLIMNGSPVPGGPDSMIISIFKGLEDVSVTNMPTSLLELRESIVSELLNSDKYNLKLTRVLRKQLKLMSHMQQLPIMEFLLAASELYKVKILLHYGGTNPIVYQTSSTGDADLPVIHIQCLGGIHFNSLIETKSYQDNNDVSCVIQSTHQKNNLEDRNCQVNFLPTPEGVHCEEVPEEIQSLACNHDIVTQPVISLRCGTMYFCALLDTGSEISLVCQSVTEKLENRIITKDKQSIMIRGLDGSRSAIEGFVSLITSIEEDDFPTTHTFVVVKDVCIPQCFLLGLDLLVYMQLELDFRFMKCLKVEHAYTLLNVEIKVMTDPKETICMVKLDFRRTHIVCVGDTEGDMTFKINNSTVEEEISSTLFFNQDDMMKAQNTATDLKVLKRHISNGTQLKDWPKSIQRFKRYEDDLYLSDNLLYINYNGKSLFVTTFKLLIEYALVLHYKMGHIGRDKILNLIYQSIWHPSTYKVVSDITSTCQSCQKIKIGAQRILPPSHKIQTRYPFEMIAADLTVLPRTSSGFIGCLMVVDHFSKWGTAIPIKNKRSETVTGALVNQVLPSLLRQPDKILTDNGPEFSSQVFQEAMNSIGIKHIFTTPYKPSSNGAVEIFNRTVAQLLKTMVSSPSDWVEQLSKCIRIYNSTKHAELGQSPSNCILSNSYQMMDSLPIDNETKLHWKVGHPSFVPFKVGQEVLKKVEDNSHRTIKKFQEKYHGPFKVTHVHDNGVTYVISRQGFDVRAHHSQLKEWHSVPNYIQNHPAFDFITGNDSENNEGAALMEDQQKSIDFSFDSISDTESIPDSISTVDELEVNEKNLRTQTKSDIIEAKSKMPKPKSEDKITPIDNDIPTLMEACSPIVESFNGSNINQTFSTESQPLEWLGAQDFDDVLASSHRVNDIGEGIEYAKELDWELSSIKSFREEMVSFEEAVRQSACQVVEDTVKSVDNLIDTIYTQLSMSFSGFFEDENVERQSFFASLMESKQKSKSSLRSVVISTPRDKNYEIHELRTSQEHNERVSPRYHTRSRGKVPDFPHVLSKAI